MGVKENYKESTKPSNRMTEKERKDALNALFSLPGETYFR